jgi:ribose transport system ATP-binding protein
MATEANRPSIDTSGSRHPTPLVYCESVTKSFGGERALRGVDFELLPGEVHALLGQNGAGKSTLIKILTGVNQKDSGKVRILEQDAEFRTTAASRAAGVAVVYQDLSLVPSMSIAANLFLGREPRSWLRLVDKRKMLQESRALLAEYELDLDPRTLVDSLPFAHRQLTEIAKALSGNVRILILDEPTSSLSESEEKVLFAAIERFSARGVGVIYVTHRLTEVFRIAHRVTVLRDGRNVASFKTSEANMSSLVAAIVGAQAGRGEPKQIPSTVTSGSDKRVPRLEMRNVCNDRLQGVDLSVAPGEIVGLAGLIGSGRTEILESIFGLRSVRSGEVCLDGKPLKVRQPAEAIRRGIALVPEDRHLQGLVLGHSIERNLAVARLPQLRRLGFFRRRTSRARARTIMRNLAVKASGPLAVTRTLSGGNQQKIVFGKWLDPSPSLLLLDEPTIGVDVGAKKEIYEVVRQMATSESAVLVVSSELDELLLLCNRIGVVAGGKITKWVARADVENGEHLHHIVQLNS